MLKLLLMFKKIKKISIYIAFLIMLIVAAYIIFVRSNMIKSKWYFLITAIAFILTCIVLLFVILKDKLKEKKSIKILIIIVVFLLVFQILSLPIANIYSQSLPIWHPRGSIFQMPRLKNSISLNEFGLLMRYYLNGKTLHAIDDFPKDVHNANLFLEDEYDFIKSDLKMLMLKDVINLTQNDDYLYDTINIRSNSKLKIDGFKMNLYVGSDFKNISDLVLVIDEKDIWYFVPLELYEELYE